MKIKKYKSTIIRILIAYAITFAVHNLGGFVSSDILLGVLFVAVYVVLNGAKLIEVGATKKQNITAMVVAVLWTLSYVIYSSDRLGNGLDNKAFAGFYILLTIVGLYVVFYAVVRYVIVKLSVACETVEVGHFPIKLWLIYSGIALLCMLPLFLLNFPGTMTVDSFDQLQQARGITGYSDHHPWMHTLLIQMFFLIGNGITGNVTAGIATYIFAQMAIVAISVGYAIACLAESGMKKCWQIGVLLGFVLYPYNLAYAITMWKDIIFSAGVLILTVTIYRIVVLKVRVGVRDISLFTVCGLGMCLLRHNGFYAYILLMVVIVCYRIIAKSNKQTTIKLGVIALSTIAMVLIVRGPVQNACGVEEGDYGHNLAIPLQQIARVVAYNGDYSDQDAKKLEKINSILYIQNNYEPGGADNMIQWLVAGDNDYFMQHKGDYIGLWLKLGIKNPNAYMMAFLDQTKGYYTTMMPEQIAYYGILPNNDDLDNAPLIGARVRIKINELCSKIQDVLPVYAIGYSMGALMLILMLFAGIEICRGRYEMLLVYLPVVALMCSIVIAAPLVADMRYAYSLMLAMPTLTAMTLGKSR